MRVLFELWWQWFVVIKNKKLTRSLEQQVPCHHWFYMFRLTAWHVLCIIPESWPKFWPSTKRQKGYSRRNIAGWNACKARVKIASVQMFCWSILFGTVKRMLDLVPHPQSVSMPASTCPCHSSFSLVPGTGGIHGRHWSYEYDQPLMQLECNMILLWVETQESIRKGDRT